MDVKTLSAMLGHVSAATTLDIYTHVTGDMQTEAAAKIDRGLGNEIQEESVQAEQDLWYTVHKHNGMPVLSWNVELIFAMQI